MKAHRSGISFRTSTAFILLCAALAPSAEAASAPGVDPQRLLEHIKTLASDEFGGRLPGTDGEAKSVAYITEQFKSIGLEPGNPDGSFVQAVPLVGIEGKPTMSLTAGGQIVPTEWLRDFVARSTRVTPRVSIADSPLVFVGYGVQAKEYNWDDYKGLDAHGKTLVMLINDPPVPDPKHPGQLDPKVFKGKAMTYYGRWTYKYEIASKLGADGVLIVHEAEPAAYDWNVVVHSWGGEAFDLANAGGDAERIAVQGWITLEKARELIAKSGQDFDALKAQARTREFRPVPLNAKVSVPMGYGENTLEDDLARVLKSEHRGARVSTSCINASVTTRRPIRCIRIGICGVRRRT